jgi:uncharacterized protein
MPAIPPDPSVPIVERTSSPAPIAAAATSVTAFVGQALRGPVNQPIAIDSFQSFETIFGGLWTTSLLGFAVSDYFLNGGSQAVVLRLTPADALTAALALGTPSLNLGPALFAFTLQASSPGAWGNHLAVSITPQPGSAPAEAVFDLVVELNDPITKQVQQEEQFLNVSTDPASSEYVVSVLAKSSRLLTASHAGQPAAILPIPVRPVFPRPVFPRPIIPKPIIPGPPVTPPQPAPDFITLTGGSDGTAAVSDEQIIGSSANVSGLYAMKQSAIAFNLLCIPPCNFSAGAPADLSTAVHAAAADNCAATGAIYIMDAPAAWTDAAAACSGLPAVIAAVGDNTDYVALYFPRLIEANPLAAGETHTVSSSGAVAGIYAKTDAQQGIWKAPAGAAAALTGVQQFSVAIDDTANAQLNDLGINCLRSLPGAGSVVWGSRTLAGSASSSSQWMYIPVRRVAIFVEQSLQEGLQWVVFEPNNELLWAQIRLTAAAFLQGLFLQGAFQGSTPQSAYFVTCDSETTTQADIDQGIVNIQVGFAPLKPAEFVVISIQQLAGPVDPPK